MYKICLDDLLLWSKKVTREGKVLRVIANGDSTQYFTDQLDKEGIPYDIIRLPPKANIEQSRTDTNNATIDPKYCHIDLRQIEISDSAPLSAEYNLLKEKHRQ